MAWKGESRRHSLARKGVKTASGRKRSDYYSKENIEKRAKEMEEMYNKQTEDRLEYLKKYNPDWFVDKLNVVKWGDRKYREDWLEITGRNRKKRLPEAIGETVGISMGWVSDHSGLVLLTDAKLLEIKDNGYVIVEVDGNEVELPSYRIKWIKRKEKKKEPKKRPKKIPKNISGLKFKLESDTYKIEQYTANTEWNGIPISFHVTMRYGTFVKSWYVTYGISYMEKSGWMGIGELLKGKSGIKSRKEARELAHELIENASIEELESLSEGYKRKIQERV